MDIEEKTEPVPPRYAMSAQRVCSERVGLILMEGLRYKESYRVYPLLISFLCSKSTMETKKKLLCSSWNLVENNVYHIYIYILSILIFAVSGESGGEGVGDSLDEDVGYSDDLEKEEDERDMLRSSVGIEGMICGEDLDGWGGYSPFTTNILSVLIAFQIRMILTGTLSSKTSGLSAPMKPRKGS